jgi:two-component system phosphate regulon response regulator PhoB
MSSSLRTVLDDRTQAMMETRTAEMKARRKDPQARGTRGHLLVVEDEQDLQELLRYNLTKEGFRVSAATTGEQALRAVEVDPPDLILLDLMLPGMDGLEVFRTLRARPQSASIPVVILTAKSEETDVVTGLEVGADDYIVKPFSQRVLLARLKAVLRRHRNASPAETPDDNATITIHNLTIRPERHEVLVGNQPVELTVTEFRLLHLLAGRPGRVFPRQQIIDAIHGKFSAVTDRSVDVQVVMLRRKLQDAGQDIQTVRGVGYRFRE